MAGIGAAVFLYINADSPVDTTLYFPFFKNLSWQMGPLFMVLCYFVIVGSSNAVNLTDGLDGLAILPTVLVGSALGLIAYLTGRYFGMRHYGKIYGMLYMPFAIFSAVSPSLYAWVRDSFGSYNPALTASIAMYLLGGGLLLLTGSYPRTFTDCAKAGSGN